MFSFAIFSFEPKKKKKNHEPEVDRGVVADLVVLL